MDMKKGNLTKEKKLNWSSVFIIISVLMFVFFIDSSNSVFAANHNPANVPMADSFTDAFNNLSGLLNKIANFMLGISVLSGIGTVIYHLIKLGSVGSNPQARAKVLQDMLTTVVCIALLGSINFAMSLVTMWFM